MLLWDWGYSGSLWVSSRRVGDPSSFYCSLDFHTGGAHSLPELIGCLAAFLRGGGLWCRLLLHFSQKSLFCLSPPLHMHTDTLKSGSSYSSALWHEACRCMTRMHRGLCFKFVSFRCDRRDHHRSVLGLLHTEGQHSPS